MTLNPIPQEGPSQGIVLKPKGPMLVKTYIPARVLFDSGSLEAAGLLLHGPER